MPEAMFNYVIPSNAVPHTSWYELSAYLGDRFDPRLASGLDDKVMAEFCRYPDAATFYRESEIYCYHSIGYFLEGVKRPYYAQLFSATANLKSVSLLDYGCGAGDDGLLFLQAGYTVTFADLPGKTLEFCRWRVDRRLALARVLKIGQAEIPPHDIVWCMDVLEHLPPDRQAELLTIMASLGSSVIVNLVNDPEADGTLHYPVDVEALTAFASSRWPCSFQDYYVGRVRLLSYHREIDA